MAAAAMSTAHEETQSPSSKREEEEGEKETSEDSLDVSLKRNSSTSPSELIPVPPHVPASGISIQAHKLWIGHLDKRLTEWAEITHLLHIPRFSLFWLFILQPKYSQICDSIWGGRLL